MRKEKEERKKRERREKKEAKVCVNSPILSRMFQNIIPIFLVLVF